MIDFFLWSLYRGEIIIKLLDKEILIKYREIKWGRYMGILEYVIGGSNLGLFEKVILELIFDK